MGLLKGFQIQIKRYVATSVRGLTTLALCFPVGVPAQPLIAVDVGHGGNDTGAISARGRAEFDFNLDFAKVMRDALKARNFAVREVNFDGRVGGLVQRPQAAMGSDFFLSICEYPGNK